jgi:hypothetical protein
MTLASITVYPMKALDPVSLNHACITPGGILEHDRIWAMLGPDGRYINGKNVSRVHHLRTRYLLPSKYVTVGYGPDPEEYTFSLGKDRSALASWLERKLEMPVEIRDDGDHGFPDDTRASGPTLISYATLETVASWFRGLSVDDVKRRFRPNLVVTGVPAFWEDHLYGALDAVKFRIGDVAIYGINPCARCVVPTRDPVTGLADRDFMKTFIERRRETLPSWAERSKFDHFYRLCVNTRIDPSEAGKVLRVGDPVEFPVAAG